MKIKEIFYVKTGSIFDAKCDRTDTDGLPGCGNC